MGGRRAALLLGLALLVPAGVPSAARAEALKVMAMGDSLTVGVGSSQGAGYRASFWTRMRDAHVEIDMVGGKAGGPDTFDNRHQGYPNIPLHQLSAGVHEKIRKYQPDVVLLLTGSDESHENYFGAPAFAANLGVMIDRIFTAKRDVKLLISTLPPVHVGRNPNARRALNELVRRTVREHAERGQTVYLVDSFAVLDPARDVAETDRPSDAGYERIGEAFADGLLASLGIEKLE